MIVESVQNRANVLPEDYFRKPSRFSREKVFPITLGNSYTVYAIAFRLNQVFYCICDNDYDAMNGLYYPIFTPAPLFKLIEPKLSMYWAMAYSPNHGDHFALISYIEWISDPYYYDKLTDRNEDVARTFLKLKHLIDAEAKNDS